MITEKEKQIMRLVLQDQETIRKFMLSKSAIKLVDFCREKKGAMTRQVSEYMGIGITDASTRLQKLYKLGYLTRNELTAESGGIEFIYYVFE